MSFKSHSCYFLLILFAFQNCRQQPIHNTLSNSERNEGWQLLFDGKTLVGWRTYKNKPSDCWGVENGKLYCKGSILDKSDTRADIITTNQFDDFELSIEWKISPGGNSGIMYHVTEDHEAPYLSGPEYQIIDDEGFTQKLEEWQKTGADYAMYAALSRPTKPVGEFNKSRIVVKGSHREYWLNEQKILEFEAWTSDWEQRKETGKWRNEMDYGRSRNGHICLQDHGSGVWFRNIKIRRL